MTFTSNSPDLYSRSNTGIKPPATIELVSIGRPGSSCVQLAATSQPRRYDPPHLFIPGSSGLCEIWHNLPQLPLNLPKGFFQLWLRLQRVAELVYRQTWMPLRAKYRLSKSVSCPLSRQIGCCSLAELTISACLRANRQAKAFKTESRYHQVSNFIRLRFSASS